MAALYTWDDELRRARTDRKVAALLNELSELDTPELRHLRAAARDARALVDLMAPDTDSDTVRRLASPRKRTGSSSGLSSWREMSPLIPPRRTRPGLVLERGLSRSAKL
jgi:hypothetical protein